MNMNDAFVGSLIFNRNSGGASAMSDLTDVAITSPSEGETLIYDGTSEKWVNGTSGAPALDDLTDVDATTPSNGDTLIYDSANSKWMNGQGGGKQTALTQAEYDALVEAGTVDPTVEYFITDGIPASVWIELIGVLKAGQTILVFSSSNITASSTVDVYVDTNFYGLSPLTVTLTTGNVTLTFESQPVDIPVKVRIS